MKSNVDSVEEYINKIIEIKKVHGMYLYRGQENADWKVECGASRRLRVFLKDEHISDFLIYYQRDMLDDVFSKRYPEYQNPGIHEIDVISDQQHLGAATMLIDFTKDSLTALFYACLSSDKEPKHGAVYVVDCNKLLKFNHLEKKDFFNPEAYSSKLYDKEIYYWEPRIINNRVPAQSSVFLFGAPIISIDDECKIIIARHAKEKILKDLDELFNINYNSLFNDRFGFAQSNTADSPLGYRNIYDDKAEILNLINKNKHMDAITKLDSFVKKYPGDYFGYFKRGVAHFMLRNMDKSLQDFEKTVIIKPNTFTAYNNLGIIKSKYGDYDDAIREFTKALSIRPKMIEAYFNRANAKRFKGDLDGAIDDYTRAIRIDPKCFNCYTNRGIAKEEQKNFTGAEIDFARSIELNPECAETYINRAYMYRDMGKTDLMREDCIIGRRIAIKQKKKKVLDLLDRDFSDVFNDKT